VALQWTVSISVHATEKSISSILRGIDVVNCSDNSIGIIGIGFPHDSIAKPWVIEAYNRGKISAPAYALSLGRYDDKTSNNPSDGSIMIIGGYDQSMIEGEVNWVRCSGNQHPQIPLDGVIINGFTVKRKDNIPMQAIIDVHLHGHLANLVWYRRISARPVQCRSSDILSDSGRTTPQRQRQPRILVISLRCKNRTRIPIQRTKLHGL